MQFDEILKAFADAVEAGDGKALAALFTEDGVYHDMFYGEFKGRDAIAGMLEKVFHRDGTDFLWEFRDPLSDGKVGYAFWLFSYTGKGKNNLGQRVVFQGIGHYHLKDGQIERYEDVSNSVVPLKFMGTPNGVIDRLVGKWQSEIEALEGYERHASKK